MNWRANWSLNDSIERLSSILKSGRRDLRLSQPIHQIHAHDADVDQHSLRLVLDAAAKFAQIDEVCKQREKKS